MKRRDLILAAPASVGLAAVFQARVAEAAQEVATNDTPVMALFREWSALYHWLNGDEALALDQALFEAECERRVEMEDRVVGMPTVTVGDFAAKVLMLTNYCDHELPGDDRCPELWAEMRALVGQAA
ncbi:hypothetical protein [Paenirhodobacter populi]|uniref:Uncharacterized protein n=1 Tax=Paenirhodobacter populi TaxID=2306993 RepID=A0A443IQR8_9RHOB|nr:hypothetical protein [Sinirhodobacter populi]RWR08520.1 hypothetical protein D2T33_15605 [Sinirhodobacter populi]